MLKLGCQGWVSLTYIDGKYKYLNYTCILTRTMLLYICIHVVPEEKHDLSLVAPVNGVSP